MTDSFPMESRMRYQTPMSRTLCVTGLRKYVSSFLASRRISRMLFSRAKNGASGKAETKIVTNPYCKTKQRNPSIISHKMDNLQACFNRFVGILLTHLQLMESQSISQLHLPVPQENVRIFKNQCYGPFIKHIIETKFLL